MPPLGGMHRPPEWHPYFRPGPHGDLPLRCRVAAAVASHGTHRLRFYTTPRRCAASSGRSELPSDMYFQEAVWSVSAQRQAICAVLTRENRAARGLLKCVNAGRLNGTAWSRQCWGARLSATLWHRRAARCPSSHVPARTARRFSRRCEAQRRETSPARYIVTCEVPVHDTRRCLIPSCRGRPPGCAGAAASV